MQIQLFKPSNIILKNFIEFFYVLTKQAEEGVIHYLTFPNIYSMVSISQNAAIKAIGNKIIVEFDANNEVESGLAVRYKQPLLIEYTGAAKEITICFKPLGLNAFLSHPIINYANNKVINDNFIPFDDYLENMKSVMQLQNDGEKILAMETYWMNKLKGVNHPFLFQALNDMLLPNNDELSIAEIAKKNRITQKTLIKHFEKHIGKTPSDFRKIVRFRNALNQKAIENCHNNLTDITYASSYFDQSHMIKDFKSLTGYTPREFFKKLKSSHEGTINWIFLGDG